MYQSTLGKLANEFPSLILQLFSLILQREDAVYDA